MVTLHSRDAYIPGLQKAFGSTYLASVPSGDGTSKKTQQGTYTLSMSKTHYLDVGGKESCAESPTATTESCIAAYVQKEIGCRYVHCKFMLLLLRIMFFSPFSYPWLNINSTLPQCQLPEHRRLFLRLSGELQNLGEHGIVKMTGCVPSCWRTQYAVHPLINNVLDSPNADLGLFHLQVDWTTLAHFTLRVLLNSRFIMRAMNTSKGRSISCMGSQA